RQARLQDIITGLMAKFSENKKEYVHLSYESVTLSSETANSLGMDTGGKSAQMSGRKGLYVNADKILDVLEQKTYDETRKRNPESSDSMLHEIAKNVAVATLRYEMIKQDLDKIITFDTTKSLSLEGDTASYIQYAYARASRILEKSSMSPNFEANYELLSDKYETSLIKQIGKLDLAVQDAVNNLSPKIIAKFCYTLAVSFNSFYEHVRVLDAEPKLLNARICLISAFQTCLRNSLDLIGIKTPSRM
ncbi:MAG: DALR anticodon-binding domain-containing protein, partial [Candidatus Nitrosotenuis sp.]